MAPENYMKPRARQLPGHVTYGRPPACVTEQVVTAEISRGLWSHEYLLLWTRLFPVLLVESQPGAEDVVLSATCLRSQHPYNRPFCDPSTRKTKRGKSRILPVTLHDQVSELQAQQESLS